MTLKTIGIASTNRAALRFSGHTYNGYGGSTAQSLNDALGRAVKGETCAHIYATQLHTRVKKCIRCTGEIKEY